MFLHNADGNVIKLDEILTDINDKSQKFRKSSEVWDRKEFRCEIERIISDVGKQYFVLAGKSTGKSLLFRVLEKENPKKIFMVNLQSEPNILKGLLSTLRDRQWADLDTQTKMKKLLLNFALVHVKNILPKDSGLKAEDIDKFISIAQTLSDSVKSLTVLINELVITLGEITLVIDEANIAFTMSAETSQEKIDATKEALNLFTTITKSQNKVTMS
jgi:hypothetical protein